MKEAEELLSRARAVRARAHAPYSRFRVGAALEADDGTVFVGCNVENASFSMTICAERSAVVSAVAAGHTAFRRVAISTDAEEAVAPCGACRQVLAEFAPRMEVVSEGRRETRRWTLDTLLPARFSERDLPGDGTTPGHESKGR